jgi:pyruvate dehydrogenase E2 component (dihydrolipoamide acetyltransferase)
MEAGKLAKWLVKEGQRVRPGDILAEIETDKATMEIESTDEGIVGQILVAAGTADVKINTPIALLIDDGERAEAPAKVRSGAEQRGGPSNAPMLQQSISNVQGTAAETIRDDRGTLRSISPHATEATEIPPRSNGGTSKRYFASPLARRLAREGGIDLAGLKGSGPHGRIIQRDIEAALKGETARGAPPASTAMTKMPSAAPMPAVQAMSDEKVVALYEKGSYEIVPHDGMRRIIAQRLTLSKQTIPHFYLSVDCRLDNLLAARERMNIAAPKDGPRAYKLSVNDFVIKALALALQQVPAANASWTDAGLLRHKYSDIGVAVAVEGGLFTPIIRHAELKSLSEVSNEMKDKAERARKRRLAPHEYQGGTTSISNLGMYGIKSFEAVINPPHATILAVGAGEKRPIIIADKIEIATVMNCTLSCDHRVVDGAIGAELLNALKALVEDPVRMLV